MDKSTHGRYNGIKNAIVADCPKMDIFSGVLTDFFKSFSGVLSRPSSAADSDLIQGAAVPDKRGLL